MDNDETVITLFKKGYNKLKMQYNKPNIRNLVHVFGIGAFFLALGVYQITKMKGAALILLSFYILAYRFKYFNGIFAGDDFLLDIGVVVPLLFILGIKRDEIAHLKHVSTIIGIGYIVHYGKKLVLNN